MNRISGLRAAILVSLLTAVPLVGLTTAGHAKSAESVVVSLEVAGPATVPEKKEVVYRGEFIAINARLKSNGATKSGPFKVRFYLSSSREGREATYEFDVFHDVYLSSHREGGGPEPGFDRFHNVTRDQSGGVSVAGEYPVPFAIGSGYTYWIVAEVSPDDRVTEGSKTKAASVMGAESGEKKTIKTTTVIEVPCDNEKFIPYYEDPYNCPPREGEND
jgi:hypothetical protein